MKIAYYTEWSPNAPTGVLRKIIGQVTAWKELGHDVRLFSLSARGLAAPALGYEAHGKVYGRIAESALRRYPWARLGYVNKLVSVGSVDRDIRAFGPDIIYYRQQGPWYPGLTRILSSAPFVMEINSNAAELGQWGRFREWYETATRARVLKRTSGFVCVSKSIAREYLDTGKPVAVVANSMWGSTDGRLPPSGNAAPAFVFVSSRLTGGNSWHGADKLIDLAAVLADCTFHIVGLSREDFAGAAIPSNMVIHGERYGDDLVEIYRRSDIGVGSLALHRRSIDDNSALKPLEYLMYGLPLVLGYRETEEDLNVADYTLLLPNTETNVRDHAQQIRAFAERWRSRRVTADIGYLSAATLEAKRLEFMEAVRAGRPWIEEAAMRDGCAR